MEYPHAARKKSFHMRPTAVVARVLKECKKDTCALSETRRHGKNQIQEVGGGYTFFLNGTQQTTLHKFMGLVLQFGLTL